MSDDDWRATLTISGEGVITRVVDQLRGADVADQVRAHSPSGVVVSQDKDKLFFYSDTRSEVETAGRVAQSVAAQHQFEATDVTVERWHHEEEVWEPAAVGLPSTPEEHARERARLDATERADSRHEGFAEWEVDVELTDRRAAVAFSEKLQSEGIPNRRASRFVRITAETEADARALGARLSTEVPAGGRVSGPLGSQAEAWSTLHPYAFLGGLGN